MEQINSELIKGNITTIILQLLSKSDCYGYELIKKAESISEGSFLFKEGTLYPILHALEKQKHINSYWENTSSDRKRKYYSITASGKEILQDKVSEWQTFQLIMERFLSGSELIKGVA